MLLNNVFVSTSVPIQVIMIITRCIDLNLCFTSVLLPLVSLACTSCPGAPPLVHPRARAGSRCSDWPAAPLRHRVPGSGAADEPRPGNRRSLPERRSCPRPCVCCHKGEESAATALTTRPASPQTEDGGRPRKTEWRGPTRTWRHPAPVLW